MVKKQPTSDSGWWSKSELAEAKLSLERNRKETENSGQQSPSEFTGHELAGAIRWQSPTGFFDLFDGKVGSIHEDLVGLELGRYVIKGFLGRGGFGVVLRAYDKELDRELAVKLPRPDHLCRDDLSGSAMNEAQAAAKLRHPGILQIYDVGQIGAVPYIAVELCEGPTLAEWLETNDSPLESKTVAKLMIALADAVGYAHSRGVIHQDLKPANIFLEGADDSSLQNGPVIRVTDFGLSCRVTDDGIVMAPRLGGTRRYMAPEQASNDTSLLCTATDIFALGVILEDLLAHPKPKETHDDITHAFQSRRRRHESPDLQAIRAKCVSADPNERYRDGTSLKHELVRYLDGFPVSARPVGRLGFARYWIKRNPQLGILLGFLAVLVVAVPAYLHVQFQRERQLRAVAEERRSEARRAVDEMYTQVAETWIARDGAFDQVQQDFLLKALQHYEQWATEDEADPKRKHEASIAWHRVANMHSRLGHARLGALARQKCIRLLEELVHDDPTNRRMRYDHFYNLMVFSNESNSITGMLNDEERIASGLKAHQEISSLLAEDPTNPVYLDAMAASARVAGQSLWSMSRRDEAREVIRSGLTATESLVAANPDNINYQANLAQSLALLSQFTSDKRQSLTYSTAALSRYRDLFRKQPNEAEIRILLSAELRRAATLHRDLAELPEGRQRCMEALSIQDSLCRDFPDRIPYRMERLSTLYDLGCLEQMSGNNTEAARLVSEAISGTATIVENDPDNDRYASRLHYFLERSPVPELRDKERAATILARMKAKSTAAEGVAQ